MALFHDLHGFVMQDRFAKGRGSYRLESQPVCKPSPCIAMSKSSRIVFDIDQSAGLVTQKVQTTENISLGA